MGWVFDQQSILRTTYMVTRMPSVYEYLFSFPRLHGLLLPYISGPTRVYPPENLSEDSNYSTAFQVSSGEGHCLILTEDGRVLGVGDNYYSQMGNMFNKQGGKIHFPEVEELKDLPRIKQVQAGFRYSLCLSEDGQVHGTGTVDKSQFDFEAYIHERESGLVESVTNGFCRVNSGYEECKGISAGNHFSIYVGNSCSIFNLLYNRSISRHANQYTRL